MGEDVVEKSNDTTVKEFFAGVFAIGGIAVGVIVLAAIVLLSSYGLGWSVGWFMHLVVGPDMVFGIQFEQLIALMSVFAGITASLISQAISGTLTKGVGDVMKDKFKEYRGY